MMRCSTPNQVWRCCAHRRCSIADEKATDNPLFGMWRDHEDMADVAGYVRKLRAPRFNGDG